MQVSYHGGSPLYFWPNYSLASRASPDVELRSACYWIEVPSVSLSFFPASFFCVSLPPILSAYLHVLSCYLPSMAARRSVLFFFSNHSTLYLPLSLTLFCFLYHVQHRRFAFSVPLSRLVCLFSLSCSLPAGCRQIGSRRPAVKFILLPCTATMIATSAF